VYLNYENNKYLFIIQDFEYEIKSKLDEGMEFAVGK